MTGTSLSSSPLATPPPSPPPSPTRLRAELLELPLVRHVASPPPYTPKPVPALPSASWSCDLEKGEGPTDPEPLALPQLEVQTTPSAVDPAKEEQSTVKQSPTANLVLLAKIIIPMTALNTALSFPFGASSALLGAHILSWQWPAYADIVSWRFVFVAVLCGCALVGCFLGVAAHLIVGAQPADPPSRSSEGETLAMMIGFGVFMGLFAFAVGALVLQGAPLAIPPSLTPARALAANAVGLVVMGCVAVTYMSLCSCLSRAT